jgi:hypothetical protein
MATDDTVSDNATRYVWIVSKPISITDSSIFGRSWQRKQHLAHWGVLVTSYDPDTIETMNKEMNHAVKPIYNLTVGELWELKRIGNRNQLVSSRFRTMEMNSWGTILPKYMGITTFSPQQIDDRGNQLALERRLLTWPASRIIEEMPFYNVLDTNCQKFCEELVRKICPGANCPDTLHDWLEMLCKFRMLKPSREFPVTGTILNYRELRILMVLGDLKIKTVEAKRCRRAPKDNSSENLPYISEMSWQNDFLRYLRECRCNMASWTKDDFDTCGEPLLCDRFDVTIMLNSRSDKTEQLASDAYCVLFKELMLLCRSNSTPSNSIFGILRLIDGGIQSNVKLESTDQMNLSPLRRHSFKVKLSYRDDVRTLIFTSTRNTEPQRFQTCHAWTVVLNYIIQLQITRSVNHIHEHTLLIQALLLDKHLLNSRNITVIFNFI